MKNIILVLTFCMLGVVNLFGQNNDQNVPPELEFVFELKVVCSQAFSCGNTSHGERVVIPITGGTFEGPNIKGKVLPGGADYQLVDKSQNRNEIEAIYCIQTDDGVNIHVRNWGLIVSGKDEKGNPTFYFRTSPKFDAPNDSKYNWLNNNIFVCVPGFGDGYISLKIWKVK
ncbi:MAG: DUF3237 domain-containing protein [Bacteroidales bacterium]|nr:DUF3237 domain-containing protein [Bacteroidales bacterium]